MVGAKITGKDRTWEVFFPVEDKRGGKIRITGAAGKVLLDGSLVEVVKSDEVLKTIPTLLILTHPVSY